MRRYGIKPPRRKVKKHWCTRATENHRYKNLIKDRSKDIKIPHDVWSSDVSYIKYRGRFWYLATIEDIGTRQIMGVEIGKQHNSQLVLKTIKQALSKGKKPTIFHSDQGTEFMARLCTGYLEDQGIQISVSGKGSPWENGYKESFYGRFKDEFGDVNRFETVGELIEEIYTKIQYYNTKRIHTRLKMPPAIFAKKVAEFGLPKWGT
jgi:transposase InsO family protein